MSPDPILRALANCEPNEALKPEDPRFIDLDDIRGFTLRKRLLTKLRAADSVQKYAKVAVAGHRGCGKSTELNRAQADLVSNGYVTLWASVNEVLDPREIAFSDVMRLIVQLIDDRFGQEAAKYGEIKDAFEAVQAWFQEVTRSFSNQIESAKQLGMGAGLGGKVSLEGDVQAGVNAGAVAKGGLRIKSDLGELSAAISVVRRSESGERIEIQQKLERYNSELVENVNLLLRAVTAICCPGRPLVVILDDVDKYDPAVVNGAFLRNSDLFRDLDCHLIFTVPASLLHSPVEDAVEQSFANYVLPMLPVFRRHSRTLDQKVVERIREAVYRRVPRDLFASADAVVDEFIRGSGGCWRDLLRLLEASLLSVEARIGREDAKAAVQQVGQTYRRLLRSDDDLRTLAEVHLNHTVLSDETTQYLLHHLCVLSYNGEDWYDIHPLLDNYAPVQKAIQNARQVDQ